MGKVNHQATAVHLLNDLFAKLTDSVVGVAAAGGVADVVVTIVAKRDIDDTPLGKMLHIGQFMTESQAVFNAEHDAATPLALVFVKVLRGAGNAEITAVGLHDILYLVENGIGIGRRSDRNRLRTIGQMGWLHPRGIHFLRKTLADFGLWQIGYHRDSLLTAVLHLVHIHEDTGIALLEMDTLREEHRRVAMGVEGNHALMEQLGLMELRSLANHPFEDGESAFEPFGMPLHAHDALLLRTLDGLDGAVGGSGRHPETLSGIAYGLMMEGVYEDILRAIESADLAVLVKCHAMSHFPAVGILRVLDGGRGNILCHMTIECHGQCLDATADAKHRYLAVVGQAGNKQLRQVALAVDVMQARRWFFA